MGLFHVTPCSCRKNVEDGGWSVPVPCEHTEPPAHPSYSPSDDGPVLLDRLESFNVKWRLRYWLMGLKFCELDNAFDQVSTDLLRSIGRGHSPSSSSWEIPTSLTFPLLNFKSAQPFLQTTFTTSLRTHLPQQSLTTATTPLVALVYFLWTANYLPAGAKPLWSQKLMEEWLNCEDDSASAWVAKAETFAEQLLREFGSREPESEERKGFFSFLEPLSRLRLGVQVTPGKPVVFRPYYALRATPPRSRSPPPVIEGLQPRAVVLRPYFTSRRSRPPSPSSVQTDSDSDRESG